MAGRDSDDEHGSPEPPYTPPPWPRRARPEPKHPYRQDDSDASPTRLSPPAFAPASPSISPYSLRMSPLSPLFPPSNPGQSGPDPDDREDVTHDSKDVLVQRLNALAARLSRQRDVKDENVSALHGKIDELEDVLFKAKTRSYPLPMLRPEDLRDDEQYGSDSIGEPLRPQSFLPSDVSSLVSSRQPSPSAKTREHQPSTKVKSRASKMTVAEAEKVVAEAQALHKNLEVVILNLRDRQEETEHIHALLITRLERAAQRIIELEGQVRDLERQRKESDTELLNLRIQLKAIEVQCMGYVPKDADPELSESIDAWKMEWSALKQRRARMKENSANNTPTRRRPPHAMG